MKVLHVCSYYGDKFYEKMLEKQILNRIDAQIYFPRKIGTTFDRSDVHVTTQAIFDKLDRIFFNRKINKSYKYLLNSLNVTEFDCIHAHTLFTDGAVALKLKTNLRLPYVITVRNTDINYFFKYRINLWKQGRDILSNASKIICLSKTYKMKLIEIYKKMGWDAESIDKKIEIIPNGVDDYFLENKNSNCKVPDSPIKILTVGIISKNKNQLKVCQAIESSGYEYEYIIVGKAKQKRYLKKIMSYDFVNIIPFLSKEKLISYYRSCDIFVLVSKLESFGLVYVEAMSQNMPLIFSENQGFNGQFNQGSVGYSVDSSDELEIAKKIEKILSNRKKFSKNFSKVDKFSWENIVFKQTKIYQEIIN